MTTASSRASSSLRAGLGALLLLGACTEEKPLELGTTSLRVVVTAPASLGSPQMRLPDGERNVSVEITALDARGNLDPSLTGDLDVYVQFLGSLTPDPSKGEPLQTIPMTAGTATATLPLDVAYGRTILWVEDVRREGATYATGVSPDIWLREPFLEDVSKPADEASAAAFERSPLQSKQVKVSTSYFGDAGQLVVTGVYAQGYTVSDVGPGGATRPYGHLLVFTFGKPRAEDGREIKVGHVVKDVAGGVSEFNGLTELNFPATNLTEASPDGASVPAPALLDPAWLASTSGAGGMINLERLESALVRVEGGKVCALDDDYTTYGQWKLDVGQGCKKAFNVITKGQIADFDPAPYVGQTLPKVVGTLRAVNIGSFHVWIVQPRVLADITTP
jgi:hypothetical protein